MSAGTLPGQLQTVDPANSDSPIEGNAVPVEAMSHLGAGLVEVLASYQTGHVADVGAADQFHVDGYDGHVALALDVSAQADIDATLDLLTSSHHLFDVPALDIADAAGDAMHSPASDG